MKRIAAVALLLTLGFACGGDDAKPARTIAIEMQDTAFSPTSIDVKAGERVELRFTNEDSITHDAFIGTASEQRDHEKEMRSGDGGHQHGDSPAVTVKAGETKSLRYTFAADDDGILIGCHEAGHYESGMRLTVNVA